MASNGTTHRRFAFIFPMASGHINPSLPIARTLVSQGHEVHFQCREQMRLAIEDTGARFYDEIENMPEMYSGRQPDIVGALSDLKREHGLEEDGLLVGFRKLADVMLELMVPGALRFLKAVKPDVVLCCPMINREAVEAAKMLDIPCVSLLTTAGPGSMAHAFQAMLTEGGLTCNEVKETVAAFAPAEESRRRFKNSYGVELRALDALEPLGVLDSILRSTLTLVTTSPCLQDPMSNEMLDAYANTRFEFVGPLLDVRGAVRAAGHKFQRHESATHIEINQHDPVERLNAARAAGRKVVLVSMGTVITGDSPDFGWDAKPLDGNVGRRRGLTGRELCQAAWSGAFDAFGAYGTDVVSAPLLLVALGPQDAPLGDLRVPDNAICMPVMPQVDLLKAGVDLFLTHGGQNSFTESLSEGVPVVVCPGFGDQPVNAKKAVDIGVGLQVERLFPEDGQEGQAAGSYRQTVCSALRKVYTDPRFRAAAKGYADELRTAGGVPRAVELVVSLLGSISETRAADLPTLLRTPAAQAQGGKVCNGFSVLIPANSNVSTA